jgi:hypothetical protein
MSRHTLHWALLAALAGSALACGAALAPGSSSSDASADDAGPGEPDATISDSGFGPIDLDGGRRDVKTDGPTWPTDAACGEAGLSGEAGEPFDCQGMTCWSGSSYCGYFAIGRMQPFFYPTPGCHPLPCECAPKRSCACLGQLPDYCRCDDDGGVIDVFCSLP